MPDMIPVTMQVPAELLAKAINAQRPIDRCTAMVTRLGEACTKAKAAHEIDCAPQTITKLIRDGRLKSACEGTKVDVRSLADYINRREDIDRETRLKRKFANNLRV